MQRSEIVALCFTSGHLALLTYMLLSLRLNDLLLLLLLFATGISSIGLLATSKTRKSIALLVLCSIPTFYAGMMVSTLIKQLDFMFRWAIAIVVTYANAIKKDNKSVWMITGALTLNLLLCLCFLFLL